MENNKKTILVTGATGFLGSHVLKSLIREKEYNIVCLKRSFSNMQRLTNLNMEQVKFYDIDLVDIENAFKENKIDVIVHMATEYGRKDKTIYEVLETNLIYPLKIAEIGIKYKVKSFINTDSYFNKESFTYNYLLNYSLSKKSLLSWLNALSKKISIVNVVLEHIYGEYDNDTKFIEYIIRSIAIDEKSEIDLTYGHQRRDFIYISDVVDAFKKIIKFALEEEFHYKVFEVGDGEAVEIKNFVETVKKISNSKTKLNYGKISYRNDEIMESKADIQELLNIKWEPKIKIEEGIKRIIDIYRGEINGE